MNVLLICRSFPHHRPGGLEWTSQDLLEGLMEAGHRVSVLTTPLPPTPALRRLEPNGELIPCGSRPGRYDVGFFRELRRTLPAHVRRLGIDAIHAQGFAGVAVPRGLPLVTTVHGTLWSETPLRRQRGHSIGLSTHWRFLHRHLFAPLWNAFLRRDPIISVDSDFTRHELQAEAGTTPLTHVHTVPLGFDLGRFPMMTRSDARRALNIPQDAILLAGIGRLESIKRPRWLLEGFAACAAAHPRLRLHIAGDGPERPGLLASAAPWGERVAIPGVLPSDQLPTLLAAADLFLNADHGSPAFGLTNAEALVMGTPVLATDSGAHREVIGTDGALVPMNEDTAWSKELAALVGRLPETDQTRTARAERAREKFSRARMVAGYVRLYELAAAGRR